MNLHDLLAQRAALQGPDNVAPSYAAGSLGDTYLKGLLANPEYQANLAAYNDKANWSSPTDVNGSPTSGPSQYHNPAQGSMPSDLVNIPGFGWINPNTNDPMGLQHGVNVWSSPDTTAGNSYQSIGFDQSGNVGRNNTLATEKNMSFGQTLLHDVLPLAAFVLGGGALAGGFAGAGAAAGGAAGEAGAGAAAGGYTGAGFGSALAGGEGVAGGSAIGGGSLGLGASGSFGAGAAGGYTGTDFGGAFGAAGGSGEAGSSAATGAFGDPGSSFGGLGSGFNGLGINSSVLGSGDLSSFGALSPASGGVPTGTFSGGIGSAAGDGLGTTLGSGYEGTGVNSSIDAGTAQGQTGLRGLFNQAKGLYNGPIGQTYRGASTLYDLYASHEKAKNAQNMMNDITNNFSQNGAYSQGLQRQLAAKDAAAGRNSQYGQRAVDLQQALAQGNANALMSPAYQGLNSTYNTNKYGGLTSLSKLFGAGSAATSAIPSLGNAASSAASGVGDWLGSLF